MTTNAYAGQPGGLGLYFATADKTGRPAFVKAFTPTNEAGESFSSANPFPMQPSYVVEALSANFVRDYSGYGVVELDFRSVTGTITIKRDLTDGTTVLTGFYDQNGGGPYIMITAAGVYQIAGGKIQWSTASGAPTCTVRAAQ